MVKTFFRFLNLFSPKYKWGVFLLFLSSIVAGFFEVLGVAMVFPFMMVLKTPEIVETNSLLKSISDFMNFTSPDQMIYLIAFVIGSIFAIKNLYNITYLYVSFGFVMRWKNYVIKKIMHKYLLMPYKYHLSRRASDMMTVLRQEVAQSFDNFILQFILMISNMVILISLLSLIIYLFFLPALIAGSVMLLLVGLQSALVRRTSKKVDNIYFKAKNENNLIMQKSIVGIKEAKSFLKEGIFIEEFDILNKEISHHDRMFTFVRHLPSYITEVVLISSVITMACMILMFSDQPSDSLTHLAVLALVGFRIVPAINKILQSYAMINSSESIVKSVSEELNIEDQQSENMNSIDALDFKEKIELSNIHFSYNDEKNMALKGLNLSIKKGEFLGVIGASGAGKSTLIDLLLGLLLPNKGTFKLDNVKLDHNNIRPYRSKIGYVSQAPFLVADTLKRNIAYGLNDNEIDERRVIEVLKQVELYDFFDDKSGIETKIHEGGKSLSGGQKQRIAIARALYINPEILILDEATSALDVETEEKISKVFDKLKGQLTIISIAHRLSTLKACDRIIMVADGIIIDEGNFKNLYDKNDQFKNLVNLSNIGNEYNI